MGDVISMGRFKSDQCGRHMQESADKLSDNLDDLSKTYLQIFVLRQRERELLGHAIDTDKVEAAEAAIEYLENHRSVPTKLKLKIGPIMIYGDKSSH